MTNDAIATELGITRDAVRYHLKEIHSKLGTGGERGLLGGIGEKSGNRGLFWWLPAGLTSRAATGTVVGLLGLAGFGAFQALPRDGDEQHCAVRVISAQEAVALGDWRLAYTPQQPLCASTPEKLSRLRAEIDAAGGLPLVYPTPGPPRTFGTPPGAR
jgi:hypothetical protein